MTRGGEVVGMGCEVRVRFEVGLRERCEGVGASWRVLTCSGLWFVTMAWG